MWRTAVPLMLVLIVALAGCSGSGRGKRSLPSTGSSGSGTAATAEAPAAADGTPGGAGRTGGGNGTVPNAFVGQWSGEVRDATDPQAPYAVTARINGGRVGQSVASVAYPDLGCRAHWELLRTSGQAILVREVIDSGVENCIGTDVTLTLGQDGRLAYAFEQPWQGRGQLTKR